MQKRKPIKLIVLNNLKAFNKLSRLVIIVFLWKTINGADKFWAILMNKKTEKTSNKLNQEGKGAITTDLMEIKGLIKEYSEHLRNQLMQMKWANF